MHREKQREGERINELDSSWRRRRRKGRWMNHRSKRNSFQNVDHHHDNLKMNFSLLRLLLFVLSFRQSSQVMCVQRERERERAAGRESRREKKKPDADKVVTHILVTTTFS